MPSRHTNPARSRLRKRVTVCAAMIAVLAGTLAASMAQADTRLHRDDRYRAYGRVIDVRPVYAEVAIRDPVRHCRGEPGYRPYREHRPSHERGPRRLERPFGHDRHDRHGRDDRYESDSRGGVILGGVIGGTVGNRVARHSSRDARVAATVTGALVGSMIGHGVSRSRDRYDRGYRRHGRPVERCYDSVTTRYETQLQHYDVTYVFRGRTFHATRRDDPGERIEIDVSRRPSER